MGMLGVFLLGLASDLVNFFATRVTRAVAVHIVAIGVIVGLTATLYATLDTITSSLVVAIPPYARIGMSWVMPNDLGLCLSAVASARVARYVYDWQIQFTKLKIGESA